MHAACCHRDASLLAEAEAAAGLRVSGGAPGGVASLASGMHHMRVSSDGALGSGVLRGLNLEDGGMRPPGG